MSWRSSRIAFFSTAKSPGWIERTSLAVARGVVAGIGSDKDVRDWPERGPLYLGKVRHIIA
jgi:hypothetical protein